MAVLIRANGRLYPGIRQRATAPEKGPLHHEMLRPLEKKLEMCADFHGCDGYGTIREFSSKNGFRVGKCRESLNTSGNTGIPRPYSSTVVEAGIGTF
jgi:hypothetical protein